MNYRYLLRRIYDKLNDKKYLFNRQNEKNNNKKNLPKIGRFC